MIQVYQTTQYVHGLFASWRQIRRVGQTVLIDYSGFRIPLSFSGIFSYLPTTKPSSTTLNECEAVYMLTRSRWDPHNPVYSSNNRDMLNCQADMKQQRDRQQILLEDVKDDVNIFAASYIGLVETQTIEEILSIQN